MSKTRIISLVMIFIVLFSTTSFASNKKELRTISKQETISSKEEKAFKSFIKDEIVSDNVSYKLIDIKQKENKKKLTKDKEETEEQIVTTNDKIEVLNSFESKKQIKEEGYTGTIEIEADTLELRPNETYTETYKAEIVKNYNNVSSNELNDIPKTIVEKGTTYYLINPVWTASQVQKVDGQDIPTLYNGTMHYEGIKQRSVTKNYIATVTYKGIIQKEETESITYNLTYEEIPKAEVNYTPFIATTSGVIIFSGIIIYRRKNTYVYNYKNGEWKLVKKLHISKSQKVVNVTPIIPMSNKYKIVLKNKLYNDLLNKNITIKYFDQKYICEVKDREFEINV